MTPPAQPESQSRLLAWLNARRSWNTLLVVVVAVVAAIIRFWNFGALGFEHWDEYYFVSDAKVVSQLWPKGLGGIEYVTAPLVAYTDGTLFHFLGVNYWIPLAVSAIYGTLAALALYFLGSRLFGSAVGLIAATILATAEFSVMFSRMALADATFDFWLIASVFFIWLAFTRRRWIYWLLAGACTGFLLNAKYDGVFPLILAGAWVVAELAIELITGRRKFVSRAWSEYWSRVLGVASMAVVAGLMFTPWVLKLQHSPGLHAVFGHETGFFMYKTPPTFIFTYFWIFTSPPTLLLALAGIGVALVRFTRADRLLLIYTAGWFVGLVLFDAYPREALSLLPAVAIWVGRAVVEIWRLIRAWRPRVPLAATAVSAVCVAAVLAGQVVPLAHILSIRTQGYADAAAITDKYQAGGGDLVVRTQPVAFVYLQHHPFYVATPSTIQDLAPKSSDLYFMTDQSLLSHPELMEFFDLNRDHLQVLAKVPNGLYPEVLLQPATADNLAHVDNPPDAFRYITIWHATGTLAYPPSWSSTPSS